MFVKALRDFGIQQGYFVKGEPLPELSEEFGQHLVDEGLVENTAKKVAVKPVEPPVNKAKK
jgi:hypothetical protein